MISTTWRHRTPLSFPGRRLRRSVDVVARVLLLPVIALTALLVPQSATATTVITPQAPQYPSQNTLFTAGETDTQAAWYLRFSRGLRPDLVVIPMDRWRGDSVLRNRVLRELKTRERTVGALSQSRAVCASMGFERPPDEKNVKWNKRPLVWVTGRETKTDRVPAQDFVFAAMRQAVDEHETWTAPASAIYKQAVRQVGALCK